MVYQQTKGMVNWCYHTDVSPTQGFLTIVKSFFSHDTCALPELYFWGGGQALISIPPKIMVSVTWVWSNGHKKHSSV
jgi:hypothetical protein